MIRIHGQDAHATWPIGFVCTTDRWRPEGRRAGQGTHDPVPSAGNWVCFARSPRVPWPGGSSHSASPGIGFVLPKSCACTIHHNSLPIKDLPLTWPRCQLASFRTFALPGTPIAGSASRQELGLFVQPASGPAARRGVSPQGCPESAIGELGLFRTIGLLDLPSPRCLSSPKFGFVWRISPLTPSADCRNWLCSAESPCGPHPGRPRLGLFCIIGPGSQPEPGIGFVCTIGPQLRAARNWLCVTLHTSNLKLLLNWVCLYN
jgi:hypothetical protein